MNAKARWEKLGQDSILREGDNIVVDAAVEMPDWEIRRFRRVLIRFEARDYQISRKTEGPGRRVGYLLEPWPEDFPDAPGVEIHYDRTYVALRDQGRRNAGRRSLLLPLLVPLIPFIGFLPASWKLRLHERFGIHPHTATIGSLCIEVAGLLLAGLFLTLNTWAGALSGGDGGDMFPTFLNTRTMFVTAIVLTLDLLFRFGSLLEERMDVPGFYEWVLRFRLK